MASGIEKRLESLTRKALYDYEMIEGPLKIAIALSGGKDSLTLLYMLKKIKGRGFPDFSLEAIHVAGEFSCGAGISFQFLNQVCESLEVPLHIITTSHESKECYSCSRDRRAHLFKKAKELGAKTIAFGHHRDDSIQTLLMNLLHKGEFAANLPRVPMVHYGVIIIRPLILASEDEIITFSKEKGYLRLACQCPIGQNSLRRQVKDLLEDIEVLYPNAKTNLAQAGLTYGSRKALEP